MEAPTTQAVEQPSRGYLGTDDPEEKLLDQSCSCLFDCIQGLFDFLCCNSDFCC
ncbi:hypothetical protein SOVF_047180 [Spinacia oleracea]|nr:hypothetical protein SOVF_047180 [Spinacia oleracea]